MSSAPSVTSATMQVGDRLASLPAANFSGSGNVLVSSMAKGDVKKTAKAQSQGQAQSQASSSQRAEAQANRRNSN